MRKSALGLVLVLALNMVVGSAVAAPEAMQRPGRGDDHGNGHREGRSQRHFNLGGPVLFSREVLGRDRVYVGTWIRRGYTDVYDVTFIRADNGEKITDVAEVIGVDNGILRIHRRVQNGDYAIPVMSNGRLGKGKASWTGADYYIELIP